jgi:hypothetical protein
MIQRLCAFSAVVLAGVLLITGGCQGYQLDPIQPKSVQAKTDSYPVTGNQQTPNIIIVLDKSGSMFEPAGLDGVTDPCSAGSNAVCCSTTGDYGGSWCAPGGPAPTCNNSCKWDDAVAALTNTTTGFLSLAGSKANFGYVGFPNDGVCGAPGTLDVPLGSNNAAQVSAAITAARPGGGTPTSAALAMIGSGCGGSCPNFVAADRSSYVLLVTDGLPNCNINNNGLCNTCNMTPSSCTCAVATDGSDTCCNPTTSTTCSALGNNQCLDGGAAAKAIGLLLQAGIKTIVVGFGAEAKNGLAGPVLNAMANAGGVANICGGATAYCQADNATDLQTALAAIANLLQTCTYNLSGTFDPTTLIVQLVPTNGSPQTLVQGTDYTLAGSTVTVQGQACKTLQTAQSGQYTITFSYAAPL